MMKLSFTPLDPNPEWIRSCQINRIFLIDALLHTTYFSLVKEWNFVYVTFRKWYFEKNIFNLKFQWNNYISCTAFNDEFIPQIIRFLTIGKNCFLSNNSVIIFWSYSSNFTNWRCYNKCRFTVHDLKYGDPELQIVSTNHSRHKQ